MASFQGFLVDFDLGSLKVYASGLTLRLSGRFTRVASGAVRLHTLVRQRTNFTFQISLYR